MRILVCLKSVPREIVRLKVSDDGERVLCESLGQTVNESDEYALEQALTLKAALGCEVVVASIGSLMCQDVVYLGLAKGADQGVRIDADVNDPDILSTILARAVPKLECDLILTGVESWDNLASQVGSLAAAKLGLPNAYAATRVEASATPGTVRVTKELGGGVQQVLEMALPAVLCVQSGVQPLSYAAPAKILRARRNPLRVVKLTELGLEKERLLELHRFRVIDARVPDRKHQAQFLDGDAQQLAASILTKIRGED